MRSIFVIAAVVVGAALVTVARTLLLAIGSVLYVYLLPGIVAQRRQHLRQRQVYVFTALTGWLVIPWMLALLYASVGERSQVHMDDMPLAVDLPND
jgi:hypothetical protein